MAFSVIPDELQLDARWDVYLFAIFERLSSNSFLRTHIRMFLTMGWTPLKGTSSVSRFVSKAQNMLL